MFVFQHFSSWTIKKQLTNRVPLLRFPSATAWWMGVASRCLRGWLEQDETKGVSRVQLLWGKNILILILATLTKELCPDITFACWIGVVNLKASRGLSIRKLCMTIHEGTRDRFSRGSLAYYRYLNSLWTWSRLWYRELPEMMSLQVIYFDWPERVSHAIFAGNVGQCRGISMVSSLVPSARMGHLGHSTATVKLPDRLEGGMCSNFMIFCSVLGWWVIISFLSFFDAVESEGILSIRGC